MMTFIGTVAGAALVTLATTGAPGALQEELGGKIVDSSMVSAATMSLLDLDNDEHLAPKALVLEDGTAIVMVAPTITKDNFIVIDGMGATRLDAAQGEGEGGKIFKVSADNISEDGGANVFQRIGHGIKGLFD